MAKKNMSLLELEARLTQKFDELTDDRIPYETRKREADIGSVSAALAKTYINACDVKLRSEKLYSDGKITYEQLKRIYSCGEGEDLEMGDELRVLAGTIKQDEFDVKMKAKAEAVFGEAGV